MAEFIMKIKNYCITKNNQIYKITFWLIILSALIILSVIVLDNFWIK